LVSVQKITYKTAVSRG